MATPDQLYRDACRRLHRVVANYFAMRAWVAGADCVVLDRKVLNPLLSLERIKEVRVEWMRADMKRWFAHIESLKYAERDSVGCLYLARVPIIDHMATTMTDKQRIKEMEAAGVKCILFDDPTKIDCSEEGILSQLTLWGSGIKMPPTGRTLKVKKRKKTVL